MVMVVVVGVAVVHGAKTNYTSEESCFLHLLLKFPHFASLLACLILS